MNDPELSEWLEQMVRKTEEKLELEDEDDTSEQARKLLESWSLQTENFQPSKPKTARKKATAAVSPHLLSNITETAPRSKQAKPKMAVYRKLDAPMMVAKKIQSDRPSVDPTLIMEARRKHVLEMKAQRQEREALKQQMKPTKVVVVQRQPPKVSVADVDKDIKTYKAKMAEQMAQKQRELEERHRQSMQIKQIEESAQQTIAKENKKKQKKKSKEYEKQTSEINMEALKINLQLYIKTRNKRMERSFYSLWVSRCSFKSQTYQRAAAFNNFQISSKSFAFWKKRYHQRVRQRELDQLENRLRREKQCEDAIVSLLNKNKVHSAFVKWSARFKAQIEMKIIEEQHRKRRALLINKIEENKQEKEREKLLQEQEKGKNQQRSPNGSPKKGELLPKPKTKFKPIKIDPKFEEMQRRAEEQKKRRLEKAQKEAEMAEAMEREKAKAELEAKRKKKLEHQQFLEEEKRKRDEQKRREEEFQRALERKKYVAVASSQFRLRRLQLNAFSQWAKILRIKEEMERAAEDNYTNTLMRKGMDGILLNQQEKENERMQKANAFFNDRLSHYIFLQWYNVYMETYEKEERVRQVSEKYLMKVTIEKIIDEKRKRQKAKFAMATKHQEMYILRACMRVWPLGCAAIRDEERKAEERENLMKKALQIFDELSDSDL